MLYQSNKFYKPIIIPKELNDKGNISLVLSPAGKVKEQRWCCRGLQGSDQRSADR